jgi:hypothetical protein
MLSLIALVWTCKYMSQTKACWNIITKKDHFFLLTGYFGISRACISTYSYADNLRLCQDNATYSGFHYFFYENQCCYSYTYDTWSSTGCFCADNYCNTHFLQPTTVPRSNDTTTFSWYNPDNATESPSSPPSTMPYLYNSNDTFNNSNFVSCYECWYSGNSIDTSDESACSPQNNSLGGRTCAGVACQTYSYSSPGKHFISINRTMFQGLCIKTHNQENVISIAVI